MNYAFFLLLFSFLFQFSIFSQSNTYAVTDISFSKGSLTRQDTTVETPLMHVRLSLPDIHSLGKITFDVMDANGRILFGKKEVFPSEFPAFWSEGFLTIPIPFILYPQGSYQVKTTLQTPELLYLPQLINHYPQ